MIDFKVSIEDFGGVAPHGMAVLKMESRGTDDKIRTARIAIDRATLADAIDDRNAFGMILADLYEKMVETS